eukprot:g9087.t1
MEYNNKGSTEEHTPDMYLCPISRSLMHDPVVIVETGQVYDHSSILKWFESGHNTCPLTGVTLTNQRVVPLPSFSDCISDWASTKGLVMKSHEKQLPKEDDNDGTLKYLDNPSRSASLVSTMRISVYDAQGVHGLLKTQQPVAVQYAAMVVLRELILHSDERKLRRQVLPHVELEDIKHFLKNDNLQVPATRLLLAIKGALDRDELVQLLVIPNVDVQFELLSRLVEHLCYRRPSPTTRAGYIRSAMNSLLGRFRRSTAETSSSFLLRRSRSF